jgi:N-formylmaleamate deformylase
MKIKILQLILGIVTALTAVLAITKNANSNATPSFKVEVLGNRKQAMIFIPGLTCPGHVWNETLGHYQKKYTCQMMT